MAARQYFNEENLRRMEENIIDLEDDDIEGGVGSPPDGTGARAQSYNSWRYGDEASLYSIAEDSREDRQSEILSAAMQSSIGGGGSSASGAASVHTPPLQSIHTAAAAAAAPQPPARETSATSSYFSFAALNPWERARSHNSNHNNETTADDHEDLFDPTPSSRHQQQQDFDDETESRTVEVKWVTDVDIEDDADSAVLTEEESATHVNERSDRFAPGMMHDNLDTDDDDDDGENDNANVSRNAFYAASLGYRRRGRSSRRRRFYGWAFVVGGCVVLAAIAVGVSLAVTRTRENDQEAIKAASSTGAEEQKDTSNQRPPMSTPVASGGPAFTTVAPPEQPTEEEPAETPTTLPAFALSEEASNAQKLLIQEAAIQHVTDSLATCPYAELEDLTKIELPQAEVFNELVMEVQRMAQIDANDNVSISAAQGQDYLLERFALLMLFFKTNGEFWEVNDGWYTEDDVCNWSAQRKICHRNNPGEAAMTYLDLHSNNLSGELPKEICCMPALKKLFLYSNRLKGEIPTCLYAMGLDDLDLDNNRFSQAAVIYSNEGAAP